VERGWAAEESTQRRAEIEALTAEDATLARAQHQAELELEAFVQDLDRARALLADLDGAVRAVEQQRDEAAMRTHKSRELLLARTREAAEWETRWARAEQTRTELETALESRIQEERDARGKIAGIEAEITGLSAGLAGLMDDESTQRARVEELLQRFQSEKAEVQEGEDEARKSRFELTELAELLHSLELDRVQVRADLDLTFERLRTEYSMKGDEWQAEALPEGFDPEAAAKDLEDLRTKFQGLGPVNLLALDDYTQKKQRYEFLVQQRADLVSAKTQLLEAIEKINVTASELFVETFEKVQTHFRDIFKTLFEGGDAELRKQGEDPLECEIEIVAKPRGKHLQSISLMSGGERALTAIALLFALYLVKPSPFCLLDEVDAPLDDANVERFLRMLRRFSDRTQFVVITHNKKTMESATRLYGVTMQELGVSTLVSVQFDNIDRTGRVVQPRETEEAVPV
jgi:chromosome segregation protein